MRERIAFRAIRKKAAFGDGSIKPGPHLRTISTKFFLVPKIPLRRSNDAVSTRLCRRRNPLRRFDHATIEFSNCLQNKCLRKKLLVARFDVPARLASP